MKKMIWIVLVCGVAALVALAYFRNQAAPTRDDVPIASFYYSHSGSSMSDLYSYEVDADEESGETMVHYKFCNGNETYSLPVDEDLMQELAAIVDHHNLRRWDGFNKTNSLVMDGYGFSLRIDFAGGTSLSARGSNSFPKGYGEAVDAIDKLFQDHLKKHGIEQEGG